MAEPPAGSNTPAPAAAPATPPAAAASAAPTASATGTTPQTPTKDSKNGNSPGSNENSFEKGRKLALEARNQMKSSLNSMRRFFQEKKHILAEWPEIFSMVFSNDAPTRKAAIFFSSCFAGALLMLFLLAHRYWVAKKAVFLAEAERRARYLQSLVRKEMEETKRRGALAKVGSFVVELKEIPDQKRGSSELDTAEVEIVLLCDQEITKEYIEDHVIQVKNQLTNVLTAMDREDLLSRDGKKRLKILIQRKLNEWLPRGKVRDVYFPRLIAQ